MIFFCLDREKQKKIHKFYFSGKPKGEQVNSQFFKTNPTHTTQKQRQVTKGEELMKKIGQQTLQFQTPPSVFGRANVVGKKEGAGPLAHSFDIIGSDDTFGTESWEKAESSMQKQAMDLALDRCGLEADRLDFIFAGDLLNQCIGSSFAMRGQNAPFFGLYGACSTMGEGLILGAMTLDGGFGSHVSVSASSHFCTAERQYRTPLEYGGQRTPTAQWTVTGAGAVILAGNHEKGPFITHATVGKITDKGITDTNNMGAAMAPAAFETIKAHFADCNRKPEFYDLIVTGDLGQLGRELLLELFREEGIELSSNHTDCGILIFDPSQQDIQCGGSGCGCCASVLTGYLLSGLEKGTWNHILFCPTGSLHSPTSAFQGESIPSICHAIAISNNITP